jgi:hypothetical protein
MNDSKRARTVIKGCRGKRCRRTRVEEAEKVAFLNSPEKTISLQGQNRERKYECDEKPNFRRGTSFPAGGTLVPRISTAFP